MQPAAPDIQTSRISRYCASYQIAALCLHCYLDVTNSDLKYASWDGGAWLIETVDSSGFVGQATSLALDAAGNPAISYTGVRSADLKYASWDGGAWRIETVETLWGISRSTSLALDVAGVPQAL